MTLILISKIIKNKIGNSHAFTPGGRVNCHDLQEQKFDSVLISMDFG